jgi:hypothetical protein
MAKKNNQEIEQIETTEPVETENVSDDEVTKETREQRIARSQMDTYPGNVGTLNTFKRVGKSGDWKINFEIDGHNVSGFFNPVTLEFKGNVYHAVGVKTE